jgi:hypothetical protein
MRQARRAEGQKRRPLSVTANGPEGSMGMPQDLSEWAVVKESHRVAGYAWALIGMFVLGFMLGKRIFDVASVLQHIQAGLHHMTRVF